MSHLIKDFTAPEYILVVHPAFSDGEIKIRFSTQESEFTCILLKNGDVENKLETRRFEGW